MIWDFLHILTMATAPDPKQEGKLVNLPPMLAMDYKTFFYFVWHRPANKQVIL